MSNNTDTDTDSTDRQTAVAEAKDALEYLRGPFSNTEIAAALAGDETPLTLDTLGDEEAISALNHQREKGNFSPTLEELADFVVEFNHTRAVDNAALHSAHKHASNMVEQGTDRATAVSRIIAVNDMPTRLARRFVRSEIDMAESSGYSHPQDFEDDLSLRRIEAELWSYERNRDERLRLWDEMLAYTRYRTTIEYKTEEYGKATEHTERYWETSSANAHNRHIRELKRKKRDGAFIFEKATTVPEERYFPDFDPLPDVEDFVFSEGN